MQLKKLNILFIPLDAVGHVNACTGIAQVLIKSGHKVLFAVNDVWKGKLSKYGIEEVLFKIEGRDRKADAAKHWGDVLYPQLGTASKLDKWIQWKQIYKHFIEDVKKVDQIIEQLLPQIRPDIIIIDQIVSLPSVERSGIPWVLSCSCNPLAILYDERTPPKFSGEP